MYLGMLVCTIAHIHMDGCVDIEGMPMLACQVATPAEREQLRRLVEQWNENRLDLFSLSYPSEVCHIFEVLTLCIFSPLSMTFISLRIYCNRAILT